MIRLFVLAFTALVVSGCDRPLMIYNGCTGSWVRVHDGRGQLLVNRLEYGLETAVNVDGYQGSNISLLAVGFEPGTNRPLGSATTTRYIPRSGWENSTGPSQLQPWEIRSLQTTDPNGGCRRR